LQYKRKRFLGIVLGQQQQTKCPCQFSCGFYNTAVPQQLVKEFTKPFNHKGKLRIRGLFKTMMYAHAMAISINFGRVWRYIAGNPEFLGLSNLLCCILRCLFAGNSRIKL
jgi:hypothetical protein